MAALERYFLSKGYRVAGYDRTETELTRQLAKEGVEITYNALLMPYRPTSATVRNRYRLSTRRHCHPTIRNFHTSAAKATPC